MAKPTNPDPRENPTRDIVPPPDINVGRKQFADFNLKGRVFVVTGGARGLGLTLAEAVVEAGGKGESPSPAALGDGPLDSGSKLT